MRKLLSVYLCFFLLFNLHAAEIKWLDETYKKVYRIDTQTQLLEQEKEGVNPILWQKAGTIKMIGVNEYDLSTPFLSFCSPLVILIPCIYLESFGLILSSIRMFLGGDLHV
jgi:hypothetical protein